MTTDHARVRLIFNQPGLRVLSFVTAIAATLFVLLVPAKAEASFLRPLNVTFTFDDGHADQLVAHQLLRKYGMVGTFYINSSFIGLPGYMTRNDLNTLRTNGHEIGGHTVTHQALTTLAPAEADRQICQDRATLTSWGFSVTSFAYPFADLNPAVKATVQRCGYNSARAVGDLRSPRSCADCPVTEPNVPADRYAIRTPDDIDNTWTLADLQNTVLRAEPTGGWLPFNLHHVCDGCTQDSIRPAVFEQFLNWLRPRSSILIRTNVRTVQQALGGAVRPVVPAIAAPAPGAPGVNTVRNPSLEAASSTDPSLPDCFNTATFGANTATQSRVSDARTGSFASRITMTSRTDGDAKLVPRFDLGHCASQVAAGRTYEVSTWYKSTVQVFFTLYKRNSVGQWSYWTQSPRLAPASNWTRAAWVSPVPPSDATAASFGLTIDSVGTLTTDDYGFADTPATPPPAPVGVNALRNASLETAGANGFPQCWTGTGFGTNTPTWTRVSDASNGSFAQRLQITNWTSGDAKLVPTFDSANCAPTVTVGRQYTLGVAYKSDAPTFITLYREDANGVWAYWTQSPAFPASAAYTRATFQTPAVPAGTRAVSFGLTLAGNGQVTTDDYSMVAS